MFNKLLGRLLIYFSQQSSRPRKEVFYPHLHFTSENWMITKIEFFKNSANALTGDIRDLIVWFSKTVVKNMLWNTYHFNLFMQFSNVKYIHIIVQWISKTFSSYKTKTLYSLNNSSFPSSPTLCYCHSIFHFYEFDYVSCLVQVELHRVSFCT